MQNQTKYTIFVGIFSEKRLNLNENSTVSPSSEKNSHETRILLRT